MSTNPTTRSLDPQILRGIVSGAGIPSALLLRRGKTGIEVTEIRRLPWSVLRHGPARIAAEALEHLESLAARCLGELALPNRAEHLRMFGRLASEYLGLGRLLGGVDLGPGDCLEIGTLISTIPWDLALLGEDFLGHSVAVGLCLPTCDLEPTSRPRPRGRPRFLHVTSDSRGDLALVQREAEQLQRLLSDCPSLDYERLDDPGPASVLEAFGRPEPIAFFLFFVLHVQGPRVAGGRVHLQAVAVVVAQEAFGAVSRAAGGDEQGSEGQGE